MIRLVLMGATAFGAAACEPSAPAQPPRVSDPAPSSEPSTGGVRISGYARAGVSVSN